MGMLSALIDTINNPPKEEEHLPEDTSISTESFNQPTPRQDDNSSMPSQKPNYPIPVQVKNGESGTEFRIIMNNLANPKSQIALQQLLASASESDTIIMDITNVAGFIYSTLSIASMMKACKANIITVFTVVDSIEALMLWLAGKEKRIAATPFLQLEGIKYGNQGSVVDQLEDSENTFKMQDDLLKEIVASGTLTQEEAESFKKKESVLILFGEPLKERLLKVIQSGNTPA